MKKDTVLKLMELTKIFKEEVPEVFSCIDQICKVFAKYKEEHSENENIKTPIDHIDIITKEVEDGRLDISFSAKDEIGEAVILEVMGGMKHGTHKS